MNTKITFSQDSEVFQQLCFRLGEMFRSDILTLLVDDLCNFYVSNSDSNFGHTKDIYIIKNRNLLIFLIESSGDLFIFRKNQETNNWVGEEVVSCNSSLNNFDYISIMIDAADVIYFKLSSTSSQSCYSLSKDPDTNKWNKFDSKEPSEIIKE